MQAHIPGGDKARLALDPFTTAALKAYRVQQLQERLYLELTEMVDTPLTCRYNGVTRLAAGRILLTRTSAAARASEANVS
jgi:hypothetical protein